MRPGESIGTRIIDCCLCLGAAKSLLPITIATLQAEDIAPVIHHLRPSIDIVVAVAADRGLDIGRVRGGDAGLGHREARADLAFEQRLQPARLLLRRAEQRQDLHVADVGRIAIEDFRRGERAAENFAEMRIFVVGEARAFGPMV